MRTPIHFGGDAPVTQVLRTADLDALMAMERAPRIYGRATSWGLALPLIAATYLVFTLKSAYLYGRGRGGLWKGRAQSPGKASGAER